MASNGTKPNSKTTAKTTATRRSRVGALIPQPHGGALRNGGTNKGGTGRPPSIIRAELREDYAQRKEFLNQVIDGAVKVKTTVPLSEVLPHITCPHCHKDGVEAKDVRGEITIDGLTSPSMRDRMAALDHMAKFGIGTTITPTDAQGNTLIADLLEDV